MIHKHARDFFVNIFLSNNRTRKNITLKEKRNKTTKKLLKMHIVMFYVALVNMAVTLD